MSSLKSPGQYRPRRAMVAAAMVAAAAVAAGAGAAVTGSMSAWPHFQIVLVPAAENSSNKQ